VGISRQPATPRVLLWLAVVVVMVGGMSWFVTGAGRGTPAPTSSASLEATPGPTPTPLNCLANQLQLIEAFDECASIDPTTRSCDLTQEAIAVTLTLTDAANGFEVDIDIPQYRGPGGYGLNNGGAQVDVRDATNAEWQSVAGSLNVISEQGPSGNMDANLVPWVGNISALPLNIEGPWSC
jgi:hypothetical protein